MKGQGWALTCSLEGTDAGSSGLLVAVKSLWPDVPCGVIGGVGRIRSAQSNDLFRCPEFKSHLVSRFDSDAGFESQEQIVFLALTGKANSLFPFSQLGIKPALATAQSCSGDRMR